MSQRSGGNGCTREENFRPVLRRTAMIRRFTSALEIVAQRLAFPAHVSSA